jgi:hypothetical protein
VVDARHAGLLMYEGEVEAGLAIVRAVRERHDGVRRNPWDEFECGHHYARALSSWSLLLVLSGYQYSGPAQRLRFAPPAAAGEFRSFFTAGTAWGTVRMTGDHAELRVEAGELTLRRLEIGERAHDFATPAVVRPGHPLTVAR